MHAMTALTHYVCSPSTESLIAMTQVVSIVAAVYCDHMPGQLRAQMLPPLVANLGRCMATRHTAPGSPQLWRASASAFQVWSRLGLCHYFQTLRCLSLVCSVHHSAFSAAVTFRRPSVSTTGSLF